MTMHKKRFDRAIERLRDPARFARMEVSKVVKTILLEKPYIQSMLDIGTGSGIFVEQFHNHSLKVTGLDVNFQMLVAANHYVPSGSFIQSVAEKLPSTQIHSTLFLWGCLSTKQTISWQR